MPDSPTLTNRPHPARPSRLPVDNSNMPSASPLYTYSGVTSEPQTPYVLSEGNGNNAPNSIHCSRSSTTVTSSNNHYHNSNNNCNSNSFSSSNFSANGSSSPLYNMDLKNSNLSGFSGPVCGAAGSTTMDYDPFKCLSAMAEQSLTGNFTRVGGVGGSHYSVRNAPSNHGNMYTDIEQLNLFHPCDRVSYSSLSSSSPMSSSSPPLSPASSFTYPGTSDPGSSSDFLTNDNHSNYHVSPQTNQNQNSNHFLKNDNPFCHTQADGQSVGFNDSRPTCKKSYPACPTEQALLDADRLLSWTRHHPENWSSSDVLDWIFFVGQERGLDMQEFRGENFQNLTGAQLCQMSQDSFSQLEPRFGRVFYEMFKSLLCGVLFRKPVDPDQLSACGPMSPFSPAPCPSNKPKNSMQGYHAPHPGYQEADMSCTGMAQNDTPFFKQEKCHNLQSDIDINSYDFDLDDTPCLAANSQCHDQYQNEYVMYPTQYPPQDAPMRTPCCYPPPPFTAQTPRRRPGRPRVKGLMEEEKATKDKKVKNQHLWEFIYETLMNPVYNPQYLRWENQRDGVFRFVQSEAVAQLWGGRKNNENMTYEKLSRAMRHYYRRGILERVEGRRLVYKFSLKAMERVRENRLHSV
ncbi:ETS- transcription factor Elf-3 [Bulinus truncatus]|nr:ETS- transcription factor Elf-3 [Bulinus truncatus]